MGKVQTRLREYSIRRCMHFFLNPGLNVGGVVKASDDDVVQVQEHTTTMEK